MILEKKEWIDNKYQVVDFLSEGGTSFVYEIKTSSERRAVLKVVKQPTTLFNEQIDNEAKILAAVHHENVPELYDKVTIAKYHHGIIMKKMPGKSLSEIIEEDGRRFIWREVLEIAIQLANIIHAFHHHSSPIVIRDIKPSNILLCEENRVHLIDFGASVPVQAAGQHKAIGTIGYAAPEQFEHGVADLRSDLFSLGAVLFYIVSVGENIYTSDVEKIVASKLPKAFAKLIIKLTETNLDERYHSIDQVLSSLIKVRPTFMEYIFRPEIEMAERT
ncbi:serine/threonine protein kinase [Oceanobacillus luteolus]|uniref:non-specific serine/threonine protein kinase n=1 Tax=Oceanobacillus luteolus TaxID=1274358 RepID=A0ABW4HP28_9BACI|nr:serine/threonine-protein kinase [Oceanobacillus luteolus]MCM3739547.1 serine/threonine protein kinase [Oceanobacillus luteolus]